MSIDIGKLENAQAAGQGALAQISMSVTKQIQESQEQLADSVVGMINDTTRLSARNLKIQGLGENVDVRI